MLLVLVLVHLKIMVLKMRMSMALVSFSVTLYHFWITNLGRYPSSVCRIRVSEIRVDSNDVLRRKFVLFIWVLG